MDKILIIKLGALGDVVRTTPLLRVLKGEVTWITRTNALPLLKGNPFIARLADLKSFGAAARRESYDLVLNLDEDAEACRLASALRKKELVGPYESADGIAYTDSSAEWFDMSLISKLGKKSADRRKWENRRAYQEILFAMLGRKFRGEEYVLPPLRKGSHRPDGKKVGLELRSGERWMAKRWPRHAELVPLLEKTGYRCRLFHQSPTLLGFLNQVAAADRVVTTDSLALHFALGLKKRTVALFTCTSPWEIHGYGRSVKVVSPLLKDYFYSTQKTLRPGQAIAPGKIHDALQRLRPR